jgi:hypothetical protein
MAMAKTTMTHLTICSVLMSLALSDAREKHPARTHGDENVAHHVRFQMGPRPTHPSAVEDASSGGFSTRRLLLDVRKDHVVLLRHKVDCVRYCGVNERQAVLGECLNMRTECLNVARHELEMWCSSIDVLTE